MSIAGFCIVNESAVFWADREVFRNDLPLPEEMDKLFYCPICRIAGVGVGSSAMVKHYLGAIEWAHKLAPRDARRAQPSLRECLRWLRREALDLAGRRREQFARRGWEYTRSSLGFVGFEDDGICGFILREAEDFVPRQSLMWGCPGPIFAPCDDDDLEKVALAQRDELRRFLPSANCDRLDVLSINQSGASSRLRNLSTKREPVGAMAERRGT